MKSHTIFDWSRAARTGIPEVVFAEHKPLDMLLDIINSHIEEAKPLLVTRLSPKQIKALEDLPMNIDTHARTASYLAKAPANAPKLAIVSAGTSDAPIAREAYVCARFFGLDALLIQDVGVAGLWRLEKHLPTLQEMPLVIAVAGMEGALFSVLGGLLHAPIIAVPTSVGYGVSQGGNAALSSALASCAPGVLTVNIDNGFGASAAAAKILLHAKSRED
ncbi:MULTISPECIES: nickel pincer cofactor biosynthesis protein LarB [Halocynthiibacter]|uniref:Nickel pincer cofactor biosynthesis protein LarB n=1 Tax=Halocynthiibacter halioticoli TaxID=2986804 RepID=A0AAE3J374_9RHOB|nr:MULTISPECIES: nickel pincer cofactor biosynthesis protein LarB [Halocynthiibacter]MCV6824492.1 nickel pincer cofactor biosynthesis protein LarB [Halocynthiibacter halioticoli]MCW4057493.1 nickel pincer cofactor biosynthesis protein LarB [Halocynthiibacter sp. SDUM655004]